MSAIQRNLNQIWNQLRSQRVTRADYLDQVQIKRFRGISDLRVALPFPVSVLAGPNGCGKSTVLFALACAYRGASAEVTLTPARVFPDFKPGLHAMLADPQEDAELIFSYTAAGQSISMAWKRGKSKWNASFFGRKRGAQPQRVVYLHTLSKLTNPSEVRSVIQLALRSFETNEIDASNIAFAQRILGFQYARLTQVNDGKRDLLVAERANADGGAVHYSEFHMSAGERAVIRLSMQLSKLENALVLIDEVEAGLHPHVQQLLMLELQRLALRNRLQIICTTHSPAVLETVPSEARIFLERITDNVVRREAYRDTIQKVLYGSTQNALMFLCEDEEAESFIRGMLDHLGPRVDLLQNDIEVGRDTGKDQYLAHMETLARFRKLPDLVFVLDGDGQNIKPQLEKRASEMGQPIKVLCLPGNNPPEVWVWQLLTQETARYAPFFGMEAAALSAKLKTLDSIYNNASDKPTAIAKNKLFTLLEEHTLTLSELFRHIGRTESEQRNGPVFELVTQLEDAIRDWRTTYQ